MKLNISDNAIQACTLATSIECDVDEEKVKMVVGAKSILKIKVNGEDSNEETVLVTIRVRDDKTGR